MSTQQGANANSPAALVAALPTKQDQILLLDKQDLWTHILSFVGPGHYLYVGLVSKRFREVYLVFFSAIKNLPRMWYEGQQVCLEATNTLYSAAFSSVPCAKYWDKITQGSAHRLGDISVCPTIAKHGNWEVLQWAHRGDEANRFPWDEATCWEAAGNGHLECLKYAHEKGCEWDAATCWEAAGNGHLECLKYAHEKGCEWDEDTCSDAAQEGELECLKYAHEKGCPWGARTCSDAAENGQLACLKYAHEEGCEWDEDTCVKAAMNGHLEVLKYAHEKGCEWDETTCSYAARYGHLEVLKYAREKECPWDHSTIQEAEANGHAEIAEWARANGCPSG